MSNDQNAGLSLADVGRTTLRHKKKAFCLFVAILALVCVATALWPRTYRSESKLVVRLGRQNAILDPAATVGSDPVVAIPPTREEELNSAVEILRSRVLLEKVVEKLGTSALLDGMPASGDVRATPVQGSRRSGGRLADVLGRAKRSFVEWLDQIGLHDPLSDVEKAVARLAAQVSVEPVKRSNVIRVVYEGADPQACRSVLETLVDCYLDEHVRVNRPAEAHRFLVTEVEQLRGALRNKEEDLDKLKSETRLSDPVEQRRILVGQIGQVERTLLEVAGQVAAGEAKIQAIQQHQAATPEVRVTSYTEGHGNEGTDRMREQLYGLRLVQERLQAKYAEAHPIMREVRQQAAEAKNMLQDEPALRTHTTTSLSRAFEEAELGLLAEQPKLAALRREAEVLRGQLAQLQGRLGEFNRAELRVARVQREVELLDARYRKYALNLEQARVDEALASQRMSNVRIAQPATVETRPVRPRVAMNLALGLLLAAAGAVALAMLAEARGRSLRSAEEPQRRPRQADGHALGAIEEPVATVGVRGSAGKTASGRFEKATLAP